MKQIKTENELGVITQGKAVLYFGAPWCGPCKTLAPQLESLEAEYPDVTFVKIDVDEHHVMASSLNLRGVPAVLVYRTGVEKNRLIGALPLSKFRTEFDKAFN
jgi:thioredoxin 1